MKGLAFLPALAGISPVLFLYAQNREQLRLSELWPPLLIALGISLALFVLWRLILRNTERASALVFTWAACFWSTGFLTKVLHWLSADTLAPRQQHLLLLGLMVLLALLALLLLLRRPDVPREISVALQVMTAVLLGFALVNILPHEMSRTVAASHRTRAVEEVRLEKSGIQPNVVHIILDAYGRADILQTRYGLDNEPFLRGLEERGFHVFRNARANYNLTPLCLSSTLNMRYIEGVQAKPGDFRPLQEMIRYSRVRRLLQERGYRFVSFESGWFASEVQDADEYRAGTSGMTPFHSGVLDMTPVPTAMKTLGVNGLDYYALQRRRIIAEFSDLPRVSDLDRPVYVLAHVMCPHPPFMFLRDGTPTQPDRPFNEADGSHFRKIGGTKEEYRDGYREQVQFVNHSVLGMLDRLQRRMTRPTVIIIHGDHGPGMGFDWDHAQTSDYRERLGVLAAISLPDGDYSGLTDTTTPVNLYRIVFSRYFSADLPPLPNHSYVTDWQHLYTHLEIDQRKLELDYREKPPATP
ncbi:MAG: sulfatase-like hydrolase/transferase [Armatimonadota bacterium]